MAEELFKGLAPKPAATSNSGATNVTPTKMEGDADQTKQTPEAAKAPPAPAPVVTQPQTPATPAPSSTGSGEQQKAPEEDDDLPKPDELTMLKQRATLMNIPFSNNIGLDALRAKVKAKIEGDTAEQNEADEAIARQEAEAANQKEPEIVNTNTASQTEAPKVNALSGVEVEKPLTLREHLRREKLKLVRVRITNLDPKKKDLPGEIITVANEYLGTVRKFVPFGEMTDNGYHIPQVIYDMLKERTFVSIKTRKGANGQLIVEHQNAREFALEILDPLTPEEIAKLAAAQSASGSTN